MRAYRCARTGLYYPDDYIEEWGRRYGIGLGPHPVSEALTNSYHLPLPESGVKQMSMHPVAVARSQVDLVDVTPEEFAEHRAIIDLDDPNMAVRGPLMRKKQMLKSYEMQIRFPEESRIEREHAAAVVAEID